MLYKKYSSHSVIQKITPGSPKNTPFSSHKQFYNPIVSSVLRSKKYREMIQQVCYLFFFGIISRYTRLQLLSGALSGTRDDRENNPFFFSRIRLKTAALVFFFGACSLQGTHTSPVKPPYQALIVVPMADLLGDPMSKLKPTIPVAQGYQKLPLDLPFGDKKPDPFPLCPRVHQVRFNEKIIVIGERGLEVRVTIPDVFFITDTQKTPQHTYWMLKQNCIPINVLAQEDQGKIPDSVSFVDKRIANNADTIALLYPITDPITGLTFSAGTRFVRNTNRLTETEYYAYAYDKNEGAIKQIAIPKKYCMPAPGKTEEKKITQFVSLLRAWAHLHHGHIAYVWGGSSFTTKKITPTLQRITTAQYQYTIPEHDSNPKSGFDCTSLVATAAQLCEIPYFFKNSATIRTYLRQLKKEEALTPGDIIIIAKPSHVMVVSDIDKNLLIEARTYAHGYGFVHEIPLHEQFREIHTYADLLNAYHHKLPVHRLRKDGSVIAKIPQIQLFKLASVWE